MRVLTDHKVNGLNEALQINAMADPIHAGGACSHYMVTLPDWTRAPDGSEPHHVWDFQFQNKPIDGPDDFNGLTNEVLLAIVIDRMRSFQAGTFKCKENACALTHFEEGLMWLQQRTRMRIAAGVEGRLLAIPGAAPAETKSGVLASAAAELEKPTVVVPTPTATSEPAEEKVDFTDPKLRAELADLRPQTPSRMNES